MSAKRMLAASAVSALLVSQTWAQTPEFASLVQYGTTGPAADIANAVDTDSNGSIYVTGATQGVLGSSTHGGQDLFIRKYSSSGAVLATVQLGYPEHLARLTGR